MIYTWFAVCEACARTMDVLRHWSWRHDAIPRVDGFDIPQHLAVVFSWPTEVLKGDALASVNAAARDVLRLAQWSALAGIAELTVYDKEGLLARIFADRSRRSADMDGWATMEVHMGRAMTGTGWFEHPVARPPSYQGPARQSLVRVNLLSAADDKPALVDALRNTGAWEPSAISHTLSRTGPMSCDPGILMVCGDKAPAPCLHGFPAWSLRITTVGSLPSWAYLQRWTPAHFLDTLRLYAATEQRHGA